MVDMERASMKSMDTNTMTLFHGSRQDNWTAHLGACLADWDDAAEEYGDSVVELELDISGLNIRHLEIDFDDCYDNDEWPCDRDEDRLAMVADGVDVIVYDDCTERGREHKTYRLLSARAVSAATN